MMSSLFFIQLHNKVFVNCYFHVINNLNLKKTLEIIF